VRRAEPESAAATASKCAAARHLLAGVYDWCTEGFDTLDLRAAQTLLAILS
jgi:hypothetical protein